MTVQTAGPVSLADIRAEFDGGAGTISLGDLYRGGARVPISSVTSGIAASGPLRFGAYRGSRYALDVSYELIGGGGGGGRGTANRPAAADQCRADRPFAGSAGGPSRILAGSTVLVNVAGGVGGLGQCEAEASACWASPREYAGCPGEASVFGPGGGKAAANTTGNPAPAASHGAGGGGAGGDNYDTYDEPGYPGLGGGAGVHQAGTLVIDVGTALTLEPGAKGAGGTGASQPGGDGAAGQVSITYTRRSGQVTQAVSAGAVVCAIAW